MDTKTELLGKKTRLRIMQLRRSMISKFKDACLDTLPGADIMGLPVIALREAMSRSFAGPKALLVPRKGVCSGTAQASGRAANGDAFPKKRAAGRPTVRGTKRS
ncbi:hypothetical protein PAPHI01_1958 [Pancytospora philotis]|nr:hypothetical protein PAPHI01_1958 [Pancytospora philotis]